MKKAKYFILLLCMLVLVGGVYIAAIRAYFYPIMAIYQIIATISICGYILLFLYHNNEIGKAKMNGRELDEKLVQKRRERMKLYVALLLPFVIVVLVDYTFLLLFLDTPLYKAVANFLK